MTSATAVAQNLANLFIETSTVVKGIVSMTPIMPAMTLRNNYGANAVGLLLKECLSGKLHLLIGSFDTCSMLRVVFSVTLGAASRDKGSFTGPRPLVSSDSI
jgi:hypothetical protein